MVPPLRDAGWVYTWGSGFHGQLGQEEATVSLHPSLVKDFCALQVSAKILSCGSHHNAVVTQDGELYTWGSNKNYCLGHQIDEQHVEVSGSVSQRTSHGTSDEERSEEVKIGIGGINRSL